MSEANPRRSTEGVKQAFESGASQVEEGAKAAQASTMRAADGVRELNLKLLEMARNNAEAAFDLASDLMRARSTSDLVEIWSVQARRQFDTLNTQMRELTSLGQSLAANATEPLAKAGRAASESFTKRS